MSGGVTAQQRWSRSYGREKDNLPADSHTRSVQWPAPLRASALKEHLQSGVHHPFNHPSKSFRWRPDVDCCIRGWALSLRVWWLGCVAPFGCGSVVRARPRDNGYAFLGRQKCWAHVESSTASRFFEAGRVVSRWRSRWEHPVPFFPEEHEELTRSWKAPFTAWNKSWSPPPLTTLDSGAALVYTGIPLVKRSVAMQLCPTAATTLRDDLCLLSRACLYLSGLTGSAYRVCGEAASALHAMALLQVHQAKALKDLHKGGHDL